MLAKNVGMPPASFLEASAVEATVLRNWSEPACLTFQPSILALAWLFVPPAGMIDYKKHTRKPNL